MSDAENYVPGAAIFDKAIQPGRLVRYRDVNLWQKYAGALVIRVKGDGKFADVKWRHMTDPTLEWVANLEIDKSAEIERDRLSK